MYFKRILVCLLSSLSLLGISTSYAMEPRNLDLVKQDLIRYHDSGEYDKDIARVVTQAKAYLKARLEKNKTHHLNPKLAMILDIDETALSNYPDMVKLHFGGSLDEIQREQDKGVDPAIKPTLELYQYAKANGVAVFFITARPEKARESTASNLEKAGFTQYDGLYLMPADYHEKSVTAFKANLRKKLTEQGYDIILSVSDQKGDLRGGYADKAFKLPDPYYIVP